MKTLLTIILLTSPILLESVALAQDYDDLDSDGRERRPKKKKPKKERQSREAQLESEIIREIERGFYVKSMVGASMYLLDLAPTLQPGTALTLAVGQDFVDTDSTSMSWEVGLYQGVHNGVAWFDQAGLPNPHQGDSHTFAFMANYEWSTYPTRRLGLGLRAGAGVMSVPLLIEKSEYVASVIPTWGGQESAIHKNIHPLGFAGPTVEYYTKLSHFSLGADVDVMYAVGMDLGLSFQGYFKYTF